VEWNIEFYQRENGNIPVMEFLLSLSPKMMAKAYSEIELEKGRKYKLEKGLGKEIHIELR
jgi:hypothetical protein